MLCLHMYKDDYGAVCIPVSVCNCEKISGIPLAYKIPAVYSKIKALNLLLAFTTHFVVLKSCVLA